MKFDLKKIKWPLIEIRLPHLTDETKQEICLVSGFIMAVIGICGYDWRIALIIGGWLLMKFSGLVKRVIL